MEAGQVSNMKIGAIIQARMRSTRLPGKIILPLPFNTTDTLITWPINRLKNSKLVDKIIIATSINKENEILQQVAKDNGVFFYSGDEENVLSRFVEAANEHQLDNVVRITADNPIIDEKLIDELITLHVNGNFDYSYSVNLPMGMNIEIVKTEALKTVFNRTDLIKADEEHVTYFFKRQNLHKVLKHEFDNVANQNIRLTVDYPADYGMLNIVCQVAKTENLYGMALISFLYHNHKWVFEINNHHYQKKQYGSLQEELKDSADFLKSHEFNYTLDFLKHKIKES
jgi:spore coat polysaccharide biosynthesis protein SpsF